MSRRTPVALLAIAMMAVLGPWPGSQPVGGDTEARGDWGPAPPGPFTVLTTLEIRNDAAVDRAGEVAYSGVPIARTAGLRATDGLAVIGSDGRRVPAQFDVLSRWGGGPGDLSKPLRWVKVAVKTAAPARGRITYELRRYDALPAGASADDAVIAATATGFRVSTGVATFELDPAAPGVIRSIERHGSAILTHSTAAGPRVLDASGTRLRPRVEAGSFAVEETGPVKVVVRVRGLFARAEASCGEDLGYGARLTFERGSSDVGLEFVLVNRCGDGFSAAGRLPNGAPWWNKVYRVNEVAWDFPLLTSPDRTTLAGAGARVHVSPPAVEETTLVEQERRAGPAGSRTARASRGGAVLEVAEHLERPFVGVADDRLTAIVQMPWMRYREPQALAVAGGTLSARVVSRPAVIGEAQGLWAFARLTILDPRATRAQLQQARDRGQAALERGLLVHVPVTYLDSTGVMPAMGPSAMPYARRRYLAALTQVHDDTIRKDGQWERRKMYGFMVWPDYTATEDVAAPVEATWPSSNYWSATSTEFRHWFLDGDPKWVWDFALAQEYTQLVSNYYNVGSRNNAVPSNFRGGFAVIAGGRAVEGEAYRSGWGSDDYTYGQGAGYAYLVRPSGLFTDRFVDAADTFIRRYGATNVPVADQQRRDVDLQALAIDRIRMQHVTLLGYAAQFSAHGAAYVAKLTSVMDEYASDNLHGGVFCHADYGNETGCVVARGLFHFVSLQLEAFLDYLYWVGDDDARGAAIKRAILTTADQYRRHVMASARDGSIEVGGAWNGGLDCAFRDNGATLASCTAIATAEPVYAHERASALSFLLVAHALEPTRASCAAPARALSASVASSLGYLAPGPGWNKGAAQSVHLILHGLAIGERCRTARPD